MSKLWYRKPAKEWEEALPLGNGRMGAMVFGEIERERIQVNEESMWYGGRAKRNNPDTKTYLPQIRKLILDGKIKEAERLMLLAMSGCPNSMHPYQTLGEIYLQFDLQGKIEAYERNLDLEQAICTTCFQMDGITYNRETILSYPDDCMVMHFTADAKKKISFKANMNRGRFFDGIQKKGKDGICLYGNLGRGGYEFAMILKARVMGGSLQVIGEHLVIEEADEVYLYFCADTTYHYSKEEKEKFLSSYSNAKSNIGKNYYRELTEYEQEERWLQSALQSMIQEKISLKIHNAMQQPYCQILQKHIQDYRSLYGRVELELGDLKKFDEVPTDKRIVEATRGNVDIGLSKLYFDYGRYLLISCSRSGGLPATLQGIWNKEMLPPWDSKYTININTEMNYWLAESCNLSECHMPLFDLIKKMLLNGRKTAEEMYGCRGFVCHHNTDIHGDTSVQDHWLPGSYWVMGAAWLCTHQWTHYQYTQDKEFLAEHFPIMREAALFFLDFLVEHNGYMVTCPSVSPENTFILPNGEQGANSAGVTMDNQILRDLFTQCVEAAKVLGIEDELNNSIKIALQKLMPTQISSRGTIMEWQEDYEELEPGHRHISHLYGLHPSEQITMDGTPELARAAKVTLENRLAHGGGHTGWSRAWIINHYAKLWDGEKAYDNIIQLFSCSTYPNLFDKHPPFQIDGNFGVTAAIAEMLVQSTMERIVLLPALPKAWLSGSIKGVRVKGNGELDITWDNGRLKTCYLRAFADLNIMVRYKDQLIRISCKQGEKIDLMKKL